MADYWDMDGVLPKGPVSPGAILDWPIEWAPWLDGANIASIVWTPPAGLTSVLETVVGTTAAIVLSGFKLGKSYMVACQITDDSTPARVATRRFILLCKYR